MFLGYLRIKIEGYYIERFINFCTNKKILIWNLKREKGTRLYLNIGIKDFRKISKIAKLTSCKVQILKKRGIPFFLNKYKKRKIFAIFFIVIILMIYASSRYVWNIKINVKDNLKIDGIEKDLKEVGLIQGILKSKIDTNKIINEIRLKRSDISWMGIEFHGTNVIVNMVKAENKPPIIDNSEFCDIVAKKSGIITKITAQNGTLQVKPGDMVKKGDVLIAGFIDGKYTDRRYVHSLGEVIAKISYKKSIEIKLNEKFFKETGKKENKYEINIAKLKIKLYKNKSSFKKYKTNIEIKKFFLPISITKITNLETSEEEKNYSLQDAKDIGVEILSKKMEEEILESQNIFEKKVEVTENGNSVIITLIYDVLEEIGENKKIE